MCAFAWAVHSSLVGKMRLHNSHVQSCWPMFVIVVGCWCECCCEWWFWELIVCVIVFRPDDGMLWLWSWWCSWKDSDVCWWCSFDGTILVSWAIITAFWCCCSSFLIKLARLLWRLPNGAMFVGVMCLNLFIWITKRRYLCYKFCQRSNIKKSTFIPNNYFKIYFDSNFKIF